MFITVSPTQSVGRYDIYHTYWIKNEIEIWYDTYFSEVTVLIFFKKILILIKIIIDNGDGD